MCMIPACLGQLPIVFMCPNCGARWKAWCKAVPLLRFCVACVRDNGLDRAECSGTDLRNIRKDYGDSKTEPVKKFGILIPGAAHAIIRKYEQIGNEKKAEASV